MQVIARIRRRLADESGFTMVTVMGVLMVATLFSVAAISSAEKDIAPSREDVDRKAAYAAAEAGVNDYMARINADTNYWTYCANVPAPAPVNQPFAVTGAAGRKWRNVPGSTEAEYTIELVPAVGSTCNSADPAGSMIDANGAFTIRATGRSRAAGTGKAVYRTITASFRRRGFLDFLYFTDLETRDPEFFRNNPSDYADALAQCVRYKRNGRPSSDPCQDITFADNDAVNGPLHTNDRLLTQGHPEFGRNANDDIEVTATTGAPPNGPAVEINGWGTPVPYKGTFLPGSPRLDLPPSNSELERIAEKVFIGDTKLEFSDSSVKVTNANLTGSPVTYNLDDFNRVIYVDNGTCSTPITNYYNPYESGRSGCANVWVSGRYNKSFTIGSRGDIIIDPYQDRNSGPGSSTSGWGLRRNGDAMAGLIANNFVRVKHPVASYPCNSGTSDSTGTESNVIIDAAILSLNHSFNVDNYHCGNQLGNLTVNGAIAQKFRGPVGTIGSTGYTKNYNYDDRLLYRSPPNFLDPVQSAWRVIRQTERLPAIK